MTVSAAELLGGITLRGAKPMRRSRVSLPVNSSRTMSQVDIDGVPQPPGRNGHNPAKLTRLKPHSVAAVARDVGVGWATLMAAVVDYGTPLIERPDRIDGVAAM